MADFHLDLENGNDANDGSDWANAWLTIQNGATAARIAAGDRIKIAKSPDPGQLPSIATFTNKNRYVDLGNGAMIVSCNGNWTLSANVTQANESNYQSLAEQYGRQFTIGASFTTGLAAYLAISATNFSGYTKICCWIRSTINQAAGDLSLALDDSNDCSSPVLTLNFPALTANIMTEISWDIPTPGDLASIESAGLIVNTDNGSCTIALSGIYAYNPATDAFVADMGNCKESWTASANVTAGMNGSSMLNSHQVTFAIASGFTTGIVAYRDLASAADLSGYDHVVIKLRSSGSHAAGVFQLLIDDTAGCGSPLETINIPAMKSNMPAVFKLKITTPANLTAVASVAINAASDPGTPTLYVESIVFVKKETTFAVDCLFSPYADNQAEWYPIGKFGYTCWIVLGTDYASSFSYPIYWPFATTYLKPWFRRPNESSADLLDIQDSGESGNNITFSGGWNTGTNDQDGETYISGGNFYYDFYVGSKNYLTFERLGFTRIARFYVSSCHDHVYDLEFVSGCSYSDSSNSGPLHLQSAYNLTGTFKGVMVSGSYYSFYLNTIYSCTISFGHVDFQGQASASYNAFRLATAYWNSFTFDVVAHNTSGKEPFYFSSNDMTIDVKQAIYCGTSASTTALFNLESGTFNVLMKVGDQSGFYFTLYSGTTFAQNFLEIYGTVTCTTFINATGGGEIRVRGKGSVTATNLVQIFRSVVFVSEITYSVSQVCYMNTVTEHAGRIHVDRVNGDADQHDVYYPIRMNNYAYKTSRNTGEATGTDCIELDCSAGYALANTYRKIPIKWVVGTAKRKNDISIAIKKSAGLNGNPKISLEAGGVELVAPVDISGWLDTDYQDYTFSVNDDLGLVYNIALTMANSTAGAIYLENLRVAATHTTTTTTTTSSTTTTTSMSTTTTTTTA